MDFSVRGSEIGVRKALGAKSRHILNASVAPVPVGMPVLPTHTRSKRSGDLGSDPSFSTRRRCWRVTSRATT